MKRSLALLSAALLTLGPAAKLSASEPAAWRPDPIYVTIDGERVIFPDQQPESVDGRTLVPAASVFERLGYIIGWDDPTKTVTMRSSENTVLLVQNSAEFSTNGTIYMLDVPAQNINGRILIPLAAVLQSVGYGVSWDNNTRTVLVTSPNPQTQEVTTANYTDYPEIPDIGTFLTTPVVPEVVTSEYEVSTYWYKGITPEVTQAYSAKLAELGFAKDTANTLNGVSVFSNGTYTVKVDTVTEAANGYTQIIINKVYEMLPGGSIPTMQGFTYFQATKDTTGNGDVYWFRDLPNDAVQQYMDLLSQQGFVNDPMREKNGYYVYVKGTETVVIDTAAQASNRDTLVTVTESLVYFTNYPSVPVPPGSPERTAPADEGTGTTYSYVNSTELNVQGYIVLLTDLGFEADAGQSSAGYYAYTKDDITVTLDTNSVTNYVLLTIRDDVEASKLDQYYPEFPEVPAISYDYTDVISDSDNGDYRVTYRYTVINPATAQGYVQLLKNEDYITNQNGTVYTCVKDNIKVVIDAVSVAVTNSDASTEENKHFYVQFDTVPNFAYVLRNVYEDFQNTEVTELSGDIVAYRHLVMDEDNDLNMNNMFDDYIDELEDEEGFEYDNTLDGYLKDGILVKVESDDYDLSDDIEGFEFIVTVQNVGVEEIPEPTEPTTQAPTEAPTEAPTNAPATDSQIG